MTEKTTNKSLHSLKILILQLLRIPTYTILAPVAIALVFYGGKLIIAGFGWLILFVAAFYSALLIFAANVYMAFGAIFYPSLWETMGDMWHWLGDWFGAGNTALGPHLSGPLGPFLIACLVAGILFNIDEAIKGKIATLK